jgi:hypothetical protein
MSSSVTTCEARERIIFLDRDTRCDAAAFTVHFLVIAKRAVWHARSSDEPIATRVLGFPDDLI